MNDLDQIKQVATQAAKEAGAILLQHFAHVAQGEVHQKTVDGHDSPVTDWDLKANDIIRRHMKGSFPDHDLLSEESSFEDNSSEWLWVVDPLDGTWNYINNQPLWGVSIGIFKGNTAMVAVLDIPFYHDLYTAVRSQGAFRNNERLSVNLASKLSDAVITVGHGHDHETGAFNERVYQVLKPLARETRTHGSAALELVRVAYGEQSGTIMAGIKVWDVAAGVLLVREAGGRVTDLAGRDWNLQSQDVFASNGRIHDSVLGAIKA